MEAYEYEDGIMIPETYVPIRFKVFGEDKIRRGYLDSSAEFVDREENMPFYPHEVQTWWNEEYVWASETKETAR